ncbi:hypothetical protein HR060_03750 [Catenovulum sp. SM1970]|uniref:hypothetical protein n=1 Tax=Marinifaba aquimaris TaxID=2741323 RepID=UPI001574D804|nr:hypothetical protein [Marinifaba aquimaris]NTS75972.1 hypothetical protein [Marinifaba aquimaris]
MSSSSINRPILPENPKLKDINRYKKQLNWGEMPAFYHLIASSVSEVENLNSMGFDNALKRILDKHNWNLDLLDGYIDGDNNVHTNKKPRIALYQLFTDRGFEIHCFPYAKDKEIDQFIKNHRLVEFNVWDPMTMKLLCRVNQLHKFITFTCTQGDKGDIALIEYTIELVEDLIGYLKTQVDIVKVDGVSIRQYYQEQQKRLDDDDLQGLVINGLQTPSQD